MQFNYNFEYEYWVASCFVIFIRNLNEGLYLNVNQLLLKVTDQESSSAS